jgi:hypothetical protein
MAANIVFNCDICGNPKRETNHWWMILTNEKTDISDVQGDIQDGSRVDGHSTDNKGQNRRFLVVPWKADLATREGVHHACGQLCVLRAIERFMSDADIFADAAPGAVAYEDNYSRPRPYAGRMLEQGGLSGHDADAELDSQVDEATVNAVAQSAVQSVIDSQMNPMGDSAFAYDMDEEGEVSSVISHAKPKQVSPKPAGTSNHSNHDGSNGSNGSVEPEQHLTAA